MGGGTRPWSVEIGLRRRHKQGLDAIPDLTMAREAVPIYASTQPFDFLAKTKNASFPKTAGDL